MVSYCINFRKSIIWNLDNFSEIIVNPTLASMCIYYLLVYVYIIYILYIVYILTWVCCCCCCQVASVMSDSVRPHRRQLTRLCRPWDSPGKNTGVGCHFLLQCMKVKSESEVAQPCPTLRDPMDLCIIV